MIQTPILDDFDRADEDPLSGGGNWNATKPRPSLEDELRLVSNSAIARNQGAGHAGIGRGSYWDHVMPDADQEIWGLCGLGNAGNSEPGIGLFLNLQSPGTSGVDGYQAYSSNGINVTNFLLAKITNDGLSTIDQTGNISDSNEPRVGDRLLLRRIGSELEFWHERGADNWILRCNATDDDYVGGYMGLWISSDDITYQEFGGGKLVRRRQIIRYR